MKEHLFLYKDGDAFEVKPKPFSGDNDVRYVLITLLPALNVDSEATVVI